MNNFETTKNIEFLNNKMQLTENLKFMSCIEDICKNFSKNREFLAIIEKNLNLV